MMEMKEVRFHIGSDKTNRQNSTCSWFNFPHVLVQELVNIFHKVPSKDFRLLGTVYIFKEFLNTFKNI